jgi:UDP-glucose 4-epimerase
MNQESKEKVVVTGGAGFIGSNLADELIHRGYEVHVIDNLSGGKRENVDTEAVFHEKDIRNLSDIAPIFEKAKFVFHLAALPRVQYSIENPEITHEVNVTGTQNVLLASERAKVVRVIYSTSGSAYGDSTVMPLHEELPANPKSPYGVQKYAGELYCRLWSEVYGHPTVSLRYFNVYGPGLDPEGAYALAIGKFLKQRKEGKKITIWGDGTQTRDFTHVRDVVRANILAAESEKVGHGEVINIGAGRNISVNRLAEIIGGEVEYLPPRLEPHDALADNRKARELLGWEPTVMLEDGIAELKKIFGIND